MTRCRSNQTVCAHGAVGVEVFYGSEMREVLEKYSEKLVLVQVERGEFILVSDDANRWAEETIPSQDGGAIMAHVIEEYIMSVDRIDYPRCAVYTFPDHADLWEWFTSE